MYYPYKFSKTYRKINSLLIFLLASIFFSIANGQTLKNIEIHGHQNFPIQKINSLLKSRWQSSIDTMQIKQDCASIASFYNEEGFLEATCNYNIFKHDVSDSVNLEYIVSEGNLYRFGTIEVKGMQHVNKSLILRLMGITSGIPFSKELIVRGQLYAMSTGLFKDIEVKARSIDKLGKRIPVIIKIQERTRQSIDIGTGLDTQDGWKFFFEWYNRNVGGWGRGIRISGLHSIDYSKALYFKKGHLSISYFVPIIFNLPINYGLNIGYKTDKPKYVNFGYQSYYVESLFDYPMLSLYHFTVNLRLQKDRIFNIPFSEEIKQFENAFRLDNNRYLSLNLKRDDRDDLIDPTSGSFISLMIEKAGGFLGGDNDYYKLHLSCNYYTLVHRKLIFAQKNSIGNIEASGRIDNFPSYLRFFLGGSGSVRGYQERSIGPLQPDGSALGGNFLFLHSTELRYYFNYNINMITFLDAGNIWLTRDHSKLKSLKYSTGLGIRIRTKYGLFRLDFGLKLSNFSTKDLGRIHFGFGQSF